MHGRLPGIPHGSPEYVEAIRQGLAHVTWPGRLQKLQDTPAVYLDGAINGASARSMVESLDGDLSDPVIGIVCVPDDKDYDGVYKEIGLVSDSLIITETDRNPILHFPPFRAAVETAMRYNNDVTHVPTLAAAVEEARERAGTDGTILIVGTQSILADAIQLWGFSYEVI
jgi:dihydrofolate synthase/folylpolyglutamate synthase